MWNPFKKAKKNLKVEVVEKKTPTASDEELLLMQQYRNMKRKNDMLDLIQQQQIRAAENRLEMERINIERMKLLSENGIDEADGMLNKFLEMLMPKIQGKQSNTLPNSGFVTGEIVVPVQTEAGITQQQQVSYVVPSKSLSNDELRALWNSQPQHIKALVGNYDDAQIFDFLAAKYQDVDDETLNRAIEIIRGRL